jgi:hypothetical protein
MVSVPNKFIMLSVVMLNVIILSAFMLNVVASNSKRSINDTQHNNTKDPVSLSWYCTFY